MLRQAIQGIADLITTHGMINVDFADVRTIMQDAGSALMGIGYGSGENRAVDAARAAIESPLLEMSITGAKGILFNITGGNDLSMFEVDEAAKVMRESNVARAFVRKDDQIIGVVALMDVMAATLIAKARGENVF